MVSFNLLVVYSNIESTGSFAGKCQQTIDYKCLRMPSGNFWQITAKKPCSSWWTRSYCSNRRKLFFAHTSKHHRGRAHEHLICVFCIVDTSYQPAVGYMEVVEKRDAETLLPIVQAVVDRFSIIHLDEWKAYSSLQRSGYQHSTVTQLRQAGYGISHLEHRVLLEFQESVHHKKCGVVIETCLIGIYKILWEEIASQETITALKISGYKSLIFTHSIINSSIALFYWGGGILY